jgi:2-polyprenyl-3-methyl-5-hydroxy-6-metoxy-1,4-benzoquinol methylase
MLLGWPSRAVAATFRHFPDVATRSDSSQSVVQSGELQNFSRLDQHGSPIGFAIGPPEPRARRSGSEICSEVSTADHRRSIDAHFAASAEYWTKVYQVEDLDGTIYQQRQSVVLDLAQTLQLPSDARILEIGCGSGLTSVHLAREGYTIQAIDSVDAMVEATRQHAREAGVSHRVIVSKRDVFDLRYPENSFDLILKIGVVPWLLSLNKALREVARVLRPGGCLIASADNWWRLNRWLDPRYVPALAPLRRRLRKVLERRKLIHPAGACARLHSIREFDAYLAAAGLTKVQARTVGFGPFSFLGCKLPDSYGRNVHRRLQNLADRGVPILRSMGTHYIVLARKDFTTSATPGSSLCCK